MYSLRVVARQLRLLHVRVYPLRTLLFILLALDITIITLFWDPINVVITSGINDLGNDIFMRGFGDKGNDIFMKGFGDLGNDLGNDIFMKGFGYLGNDIFMRVLVI